MGSWSEGCWDAVGKDNEVLAKRERGGAKGDLVDQNQGNEGTLAQVQGQLQFDSTVFASVVPCRLLESAFKVRGIQDDITLPTHFPKEPNRDARRMTKTRLRCKHRSLIWHLTSTSIGEQTTADHQILPSEHESIID